MKPVMDAKVEQFVMVTGAPLEVARSLLEACSGNLDLAINMHLESGGGGRGRGGDGMSAGPSSSASGVDSGSDVTKSYEEM